MSRNAFTPCDWPECERKPSDGHVLFRVNPQGETGIFMCQEHAGRSKEDVAEVMKMVARKMFSVEEQ